MFAIAKSTSCSASTVNVLPCRISCTGPSKVTKRYWQPQSESDGTKTAYFRGRKLRGKVVNLPNGYHGVALKTTDKTLIAPVQPADDDDDDDDDDEEPEFPEITKVVEQVSTFEDLTVWGHDQLPASDDSFIKGIEEWIAFSEAIHGQPGTQR